MDIGQLIWFFFVFSAIQPVLKQVREGARELLTRSLSAEQAGKLADLMASGTWTHDYPITIEEAQRLGLKAHADMPRDVLRLMSLYPQPTRRQPAVEYLPSPRRGGERSARPQPAR